MLYYYYEPADAPSGTTMDIVSFIHLVTILERAGVVAICQAWTAELVYCAFDYQHCRNSGNYLPLRICEKENADFRASSLGTNIRVLKVNRQ